MLPSYILLNEGYYLYKKHPFRKENYHNTLTEALKLDRPNLLKTDLWEFYHPIVY